MANYEITFECGHTGTVDITGPVRSREWRLEHEKGKLCRTCFEARRNEFRQSQFEAARNYANKFNYPVLTGTEKQVEWAISLRHDFIASQLHWVENSVRERIQKGPGAGLPWSNEQIGLIRDTFDAIYARYLAETSAKVWIDQRDLPWTKIYNDGIRSIGQALIDMATPEQDAAMRIPRPTK